jgi:sucrose-6-phosphate hydrolase SacC (GH32 family)
VAPVEWFASSSLTGNRLEINTAFENDAISTVGLVMKDNEHEYPLTVDLARGEMRVLQETCRLERFDRSQPLRLRIFIDHSVMEVFVNERESLTTWLRPVLARDQAWNIRLLSPAASIEAWQLADLTQH